MLSAAGLALAACAPEAVQSETKEAATLPNRTKTSTESAMIPTTSSTPQPSPTTSDTPEPSVTPRFYDTFVPALNREDVRVDYSPSVVRVGEKLNAAIHLPVQTPGAHGLLFSEVYYVSVEVYTQGASEFEKGPFTGTRVTFKGDAALGGSSQDGSLVINWHNPTYSREISYIYIFSIYALVNAMRSPKGAKLARLKVAEALQQVTLAGLPDPASQVIFLSNSASESGGGEGESLSQSADDGIGGSSGGPSVSGGGITGSSGDG